MKTALKWVLGTLLAILALPVAAYLIWLSGNISDEQLDAEIPELLEERPPPQLDAERNAYFDLIGLEAPGDWDPHLWGMTWFTQASTIDADLGVVDSNPNAAVAGDNPDHANRNRPAVEGVISQSVKNPDALPCEDYEKCLAAVTADPKVARQALDAGATLIRRVDSLLGRQFQEPYREFHFGSPLTGPPRSLFELTATRFVLDVAEGRHEKALDQWAKETAFATRMLEGSYTVNGKMAAIAWLHRQHSLLAQFISLHPAVVEENAEKIRGMLQPFSANALSLRPAINSEIRRLTIGASVDLRIMKRNRRLLASDDSPRSQVLELLCGPFLLENATANAMVRPLLDWRAVESSQGDSYRQGIASVRAAYRIEEATLLESALSYRNPVGKVLALNSWTDWSPYFFKRDNLVADRRLLNFALGAIARPQPGLATDKGSSKETDLEHPYTGDPAVVDEKRGRVAFAMPQRFHGMKNVAPIEVFVSKLIDAHATSTETAN